MAHDDDMLDLSLGLPDLDVGGLGMDGGDDMGVTENRESHFNRQSGRFHDPMDGRFERGSPPPDLDEDVSRYRAKNGQFKVSPDDLFDEPDEVRLDSLEPMG